MSSWDGSQDQIAVAKLARICIREVKLWSDLQILTMMWRKDGAVTVRMEDRAQAHRLDWDPILAIYIDVVRKQFISLYTI